MTRTIFRGTTNAGRAPRDLYVYDTSDGDGVLITLHSAQGNFMAEIRLDVAMARGLGEHLIGRAADLDQEAATRMDDVEDEIEGALTELAREGLIETVATGEAEPHYRLTDRGRQRGREIIQQITDARQSGDTEATP